MKPILSHSIHTACVGVCLGADFRQTLGDALSEESLRLLAWPQTSNRVVWSDQVQVDVSTSQPQLTSSHII